MKRTLPGTKRKKAIPARKPAAKRPTARPKSKPAKPAAKKRAPIKKIKATAPKPKVTKPKVVRPKIAKAKVAMRRKPKTVKGSVAKKVSVPKPKRNTAKAKAVQTKKVAMNLQIPPASPSVTRSRTFGVPPSGGVRRQPPQGGTSNPARPTTIKHSSKSATTRAAKPEFTVPAFLLEGDEPSLPHLSGPGEKFSLGPTPPLDHFDEAKAPLPESYGTGRLFLTARDPHWLYAHWDFTMQEQFRYNARSVDRHMVLRLHDAEQPDQHIAEVHVHPESRHWFTHVDEAGKNYFVEIGYYQPGRKWKSLANSEPQRTPPDNISTDSTIEFATIPLELTFEKMLALLKEQSAATGEENPPLARGIEQIRASARQHFPPATPATDWTPEQDQALADMLAADRAGIALPGSEEFIAEKTWPEFSFDVEIGAAAPITSPSSYVSSFFGGAEQKDFWFNVNAELIVYGSTEPNATVTFAGKQIPLRPDGSFRFRFALPDGQYELPVTAVSADGTDGRAAELKFTRTTEIRGAVAAALQDPALSPPPAESV